MNGIDILYIALAVFAIALAIVTIVMACSQTQQARDIAVSVYSVLDRITMQKTNRPIICWDENIQVAETSLEPRFVRRDQKIKLIFQWKAGLNAGPEYQPFEPHEDDTVVCAVKDPEGASHRQTFHGLQNEHMEYVFPDDFNYAGKLEAGPYEVEWWPQNPRDPKPIIYGFNTFYVVP